MSPTLASRNGGFVAAPAACGGLPRSWMLRSRALGNPRMRFSSILVALVGALALSGAGAAAPPAPATDGHSMPPLRAVRLAAPVLIDGALNEPAWQGPPTVTRLTQSAPAEGAAPSESTWVWLAFDDNALYVAVRCWDSHPDSIIARLVRRDADAVTDWVEIWLDPFHDHRSGYYFTVSAAGVLYDGTGFNDGMWDGSWDGVWQARVRRDRGARAEPGSGYTCEMRIPFSQLRFRPGADQVWGVNIHRYFARRAEDDYLVYTPRGQSGSISRLPHLEGIRIDQRRRSIEVLPYLTGKAEYLAHEAGDPFNDGSRYTPGLGGDLRSAAGNNLTLNVTANPDFGQVEVDPATVNLSDVETFFQEKRPFFTENSRIFGFGNEGANDYWGFNWPEPKFFYSRRIGRTPQGGAPGDADYTDLPLATHILGAAKLTGKLASSWNFGTMHAVASREDAQYAIAGTRSETAVEPLTYYGVARGLQERRGGYNGLGLMSTLVQRRFDRAPLSEVLHEQSLMTGLDGWHFLDRKKLWVLSGWAAMSRVAGSERSMIALQRGPRHYLQRPDAEHLGVDSSATSLTGCGARVWLHKQEGSFLFNSAVGFMDPKFDVNDMGYQSQANITNAHLGTGYAWNRPNRWRKRAYVITSLFRGGDFDGNRTVAGAYAGSTVYFANECTLKGEWMLTPRTLNDRRTRGGPLMVDGPGAWGHLLLDTDQKRAVTGSFDVQGTTVPEAGSSNWAVTPTVGWKPASNVSVQVGPGYSRVIEDAQYVPLDDASVASPGQVPADFGGRRYVFARLDQATVSASIRLNVSFTPNLSLETYLQPYISAGRYTDLKELARAGSYEFVHYGASYDPAAGTVMSGADTLFTVSNPDFNYKSLRGNAVLRWEYRPGSVLYLVWTQQRTDAEASGDLRFGPSTRRLLDAHANDIFLVKATYYLDL